MKLLAAALAFLALSQMALALAVYELGQDEAAHFAALNVLLHSGQ